jgi:hypothetical protein
MSLGLHIDVNAQNLRKAVSIAPERIVNAMHDSLARSAAYAQRMYTLRMPVGVTSNLRNSVQFKWNHKLSVTVGPTAKYAEYVEFGTRPHWTSVHNLEAWARLRGINPYALQRSIALHGTKPNPYNEWVAINTAKWATTDMSNTLKKTIKEII